MKNGILICALIAVAIMSVGLFLYEYVPNGLTVSKANTYEVTADTTEVLNDAGKAQELLSKQDSQTSSTGGSTGTVQTNIILKEYNISKSDLAMYDAAGEYQKGRSDPFAEISDSDDDEGGTTSGSSSTTTTDIPVANDGTFYNSSKVK